MKGLQRLTAYITAMALAVILCGGISVAGETGAGINGAAFTPAVASLEQGTQYRALWGGKEYTFTVGVDVFGSFEEAYAAAPGEIPTVLALSGELGELNITGPVRLLGYYYDTDPNVYTADPAECPLRSTLREDACESVVDRLTIKASATGRIEIKGLLLRGIFRDTERLIGSESAEITLENMVIRQETAYVSGSFVFNISNARTNDKTLTGADAADSFTLASSRIEQIAVIRLFSNSIPPVFTLDHVVTERGATTFFGYAQWRRYTQNAAFTVRGCFFEDYQPLEGTRPAFLVMEGLNKYNGDCAITISGSTFTGDSGCFIGVMMKQGYRISVTDNLFLACESAGAAPFRWYISYDKTYGDESVSADVSEVDLSSIITIRNNRFVGFTKFADSVNASTVLDISDNFFTNNLSYYRQARGVYPTVDLAAYSLRRYYSDWSMSALATDDFPAVWFSGVGAVQEDGRYVIYTDQAVINLYDFGLQNPEGAELSLSNGRPLNAVPCAPGGYLLNLRVPARTGSAVKTLRIIVWLSEGQAEAAAAINRALYLLSCGTQAGGEAEEGYRALLGEMRAAFQRDEIILQEQLNELADLQSRVAFSMSETIPFTLAAQFPGCKNFEIASLADWHCFIETVNGGSNLKGCTVCLTADLDFRGAEIAPVGGAFEADGTVKGPCFSGSFYGNGYQVSGFVINLPERWGVGLFGRCENAMVRDLHIGAATVTGYDKVGSLIGYCDGTTVINCSSRADVRATDGGNGIGQLISQGRRTTKDASVTGCISYGSASCPQGRACGVIAWCQATTVVKDSVSYAQLSAPMVKHFGTSSASIDLLVQNCYSIEEEDSNEQHYVTQFSDENGSVMAAYACGMDYAGGLAVPAGRGVQPHRAMLTLENDGNVYYSYGVPGMAVTFSIPGYYPDSLKLDGEEVSLDSFTFDRDYAFTGTATLCTYPLNLVMNGGRTLVDLPGTFTVLDQVQLPSVLQMACEDAVFAGWYADPSFSGSRVTEVPRGTLNGVTLYARFAPVTRRIGSVRELIAFAEAVNGGNDFEGEAVVLAADLDLSGAEVPVIGGSVLTPFNGVLFGDYHCVRGLHASGALAGLVGALGGSGVVAALEVRGSAAGKVAGGVVANNMSGIVEGCAFYGEVTHAEATPLTIVSQNLRVNSGTDLHSVHERHEPVRDVLTALDPDLIGFQEAERTWYTYLPEDFPDYDYVWEWRGVGGNNTTKGFEATPIFYKRDKFDLIDSGFFWFSDTPDVPSDCFGDNMNRICSWVLLRIRETGEVFAYFNTHFSLRESSRLKSAAILKEKVMAITGGAIPFYSTADYNMSPGSAPYNEIVTWANDLALNAAEDATNNSGTFNSFNVTPSARIDMCFGWAELTPVAYYKVVLDTYIDENGVECPPSDHYAIYFEVNQTVAAGGITGVNQGVVQSCYTGFERPVELSRGAERAALSASGNALEDVYMLNTAEGHPVWGVDEAGGVTFLPAGDPVYLVRYFDEDGALLREYYTTDLTEAGAYNAGLDTPRSRFVRWNVSARGFERVFTAEMIALWQVTFTDPGGQVLAVQTVEHGAAAQEPALALPADTVFIGWDQPLGAVTADREIHARYAPADQFTLTLLAEGDGTLLLNGAPVESGTSVTLRGGALFRAGAIGAFCRWRDENGRTVASFADLELALTRNTALTAVFGAEPEQPSAPAFEEAPDETLSLIRRADGAWQLNRRVQGAYSVLGSGVLMGGNACLLVREAVVEGSEVVQAADSRRTLNGSFIADPCGELARGYLVLLDERTGETVCIYTEIME